MTPAAARWLLILAQRELVQRKLNGTGRGKW